jgi:hypothetical protein
MHNLNRLRVSFGSSDGFDVACFVFASIGGGILHKLDREHTTPPPKAVDGPTGEKEDCSVNHRAERHDTRQNNLIPTTRHIWGLESS